ncbi:MAG: pyridoxal-phosphate dependent enzyme [Anaerolineales bacterium]|nr:pyridoxal-phosphate dependent enzyme [Anaerolineales bacterium]
MALPKQLQCNACGRKQAFVSFSQLSCQACGSDWVDALYDYSAFKRVLLSGLTGRSTNLWRYHDVLPISETSADNETFSNNLISAGGTPMLHSVKYAKTLNLEHLYIKDERYGPTSSFKDRQAAVAVASMLDNGINECVIASTGNAAVAYAAACARAGIKLWVFMTSLVPQDKLREAALFGAEVIRVSGNYDQTKQIASDFAQRRGLQLDRGARSLPAREAFKTIAYEIVENLGWRVPDWYLQAVSGGLGPIGVYRGFQELHEMGLIDRVPKLGVLQVEGCSPMVKAFKEGSSIAQPVLPETRIAILSTGDPGQGYTMLWKITQKYGGYMEAVTDQEAFQSMHTLAKTEGMAVEPATAVAFAGLEKMVRNNIIAPHEMVVVNCTGHTFPVEKHVLGEEWSLDVHLSDDQSPAPREGLIAALNSLDEKATTVLLIDDNPNDALLIRRLLESRKNYRVFHALDGLEGLKIARQRLPDLIITDLTMPNMDGFHVLEELRSDERTRHIPVIVVSARDITHAERQFLNRQVEAHYQKGSLSVREFVDQVVGVIEHKNTLDDGAAN